jgi:hypothetical protein
MPSIVVESLRFTLNFKGLDAPRVLVATVEPEGITYTAVEPELLSGGPHVRKVDVSAFTLWSGMEDGEATDPTHTMARADGTRVALLADWKVPKHAAGAVVWNLTLKYLVYTHPEWPPGIWFGKHFPLTAGWYEGYAHEYGMTRHPETGHPATLRR